MSQLIQLAAEIENAVIGRSAGRIFQMSETAIAIDFVPHAGSYLFVDYGRHPCTFLIVRKLKQLNRDEAHLSRFAIGLKRVLSDRVVNRVVAADSTIRMGLNGSSDSVQLEINLDPCAHNLLVREPQGTVLLSAIEGRTPELSDAIPEFLIGVLAAPAGRTLSEVLDESYHTDEALKSFDRLAADARRNLNKEISKAKRLLENIEGDIRKHGDASTWKRFGDLILANIATLRREDGSFVLTDYFHDEEPEIQVLAEENRTPAEVAEEYFRRYTRARNAANLSAKHRNSAKQLIADLEKRKLRMEAAIGRGDEEFLSQPSRPKQAQPRQNAAQKPLKDTISQARRFVGSLGFEILVGKKAADNDYLTFRLAKSQDLWLHAADYPGSHVIVRNNSKAEVPQKVLIEAARLAAFYSDAREMPKAAVNYTIRKFVQKPKRSAPGLVSLSKFRTLLVEPGVPDTVTKP